MSRAVVAGCWSLPLADESVDVVISNGVIDLIPDKEAVLAEIDRVLRPGGRLQIADVVASRRARAWAPGRSREA